ncbi:beta strand repeat-containing protein [Tunturiibacter gelidiferens]|uniref:beta strand repeat-containing protein n=1 Tax=Tunturiibacter gelidiferens TaxID=3069689 RepID=UPI003D9AE208
MRHSVLFLVGSTLTLSILVGCSGSSPSSSTTPPAAPPVAPANNPAPTITSTSPTGVLAGSSSQTLTVTGTGYISSTAATLNGAALQATYVSGTSLHLAVPASALADGQVAKLVLSNPSPGGGSSAPSEFSIMSPTPVVTGLSPGSTRQGVPATITVNGSGFEANSVVMYNGAARPTTFVNGTTLQVSLTAADLQSFGSGQISVNNPGPGGSNTTPTELVIAASVPTILSVNPPSVAVNTSSSVPVLISISGSGFAANATVQANGTFVPVTSQNGTNITVSVPSTFFAAAGSIQLVVSNPGTPVVQSNAATVSVVMPTLSFSISPNYATAGSPDTTITVSGSGFFADSVVMWNNTPLATTYVNAQQLTAVIPASFLSGFAQANIQVSTPESPGQTLPPQPFTTFLALPINDIVYNAVDGLIYASIPGSAGEGLGNTIAGIDPTSGVIVKTIFVGSEPTRMALSSDGTQLFVGLNGAGAVRQVNMATATAGIQFSLGGGPGIYNPPYTAQGLAVLPGQPNSVAVYGSNGIVTIFDSGVARAKTSTGLSVYFNQNSGSLSFGSSASTLYLNSQSTSANLYALTIDASGVTGATPLGNGGGNTIQYDNGRLYLSSGVVLNANSGSQLGQFSTASTNGGSNQPVVAAGPIVSDSTLGHAWIVPSSFSTNTNQVVAFDETTFNPTGSMPVTGIGSYPSSSFNNVPADLVRWGQDGLAFHTASQLYVLQSPIVKDVTTSPADLSVSIQAPATATTGTAFSYTVQVANLGQNAAAGVTLTTVLPASVIGGTYTSSQGTCSGGGVLYCSLGAIANGGSASVTISITPTVAGSLTMTGSVSSVSFDPVSSNNQANANTTVTGNVFNATPDITQISPSLIQAGSSTTTLTVDGTGFTSGSSILWNGQTLPTTFVSAGQMTATVDSSLIQNLGWAQVSVTTPTPGGGQSVGLPLHIYQLLNVPANVISFDPFTRKIYAALPSTSTGITGNSLVAIDPATGSVGTPITVGSEPNLLSETSDGNYLFIGLSGAKSLSRFNLLNQTMDVTVPIVSTAFGNSGDVAATSIAAVPGTDSSVAVEFNSFYGIGIYDISGSTGAFRSNISQPYSGDNPVFTDATHFYAYDAYTTGAEFYRYSVGPTGVTLIDGTTLNGLGGFGGKLAVDGGLVFGSSGGIVNPSTTPPSQVAVLPLGNGASSISLYGGGVIPYQAESKAFVIGVNAAGTAAYYLERFDTQHFTQEQQIQLPGNSVSSLPGIRFGQDGLAYVVPNTTTSNTPQIFLMRGPFVVPAEATSNPAPTLSSTDQATIAVGSGNLYLTVTGTGFLPGAVVLWNGSPRTTTFVDNAHLQVAIAAADLASPQTITLASQNPGSGDSNKLTVTIQ